MRDTSIDMELTKLKEKIAALEEYHNKLNSRLQHFIERYEGLFDIVERFGKIQGILIQRVEALTPELP